MGQTHNYNLARPTADDPRLAAFHAGIYLDAFASQHEPLAIWQAALRGELPYTLHLQLALDEGAIVAGIAYEHYPVSNCGLVTYMVVAPHARTRGLGRTLLETAAGELYAAGAHLVFGEVNDPAIHGDAARPRLERFLRWGARRLDIPYVQPALAPGLARDTGLCLIALPPVPDVPDDVVHAFIAELYAVTEG